jgi:nucleoside phosphorylase
MLDEIHGDPEPISSYDDNIYALGKIGQHNVVIACPNGPGATSTAAMVKLMLIRELPNIRIAVVAGIGGGAPSSKHDIRLGDIVVGSPVDGEALEGGVFGYNFRKARAGGEVQMVRYLDLPPILVRAVNVLKNQYTSAAGHRISETIRRVVTAHSGLHSTYTLPSPDPDILYDSNYIHSDITKTCTEICTDPLAKRIRPPRSADQDNPAIHYGLIATSHLLMTDAKARDRLSAEKGVLCFEMGSAGLMENFPCLVVRGICDYSDSHKIKAWRSYAAMAAAVYTKDLMGCIDPLSIEAEPRIKDAL